MVERLRIKSKDSVDPKDREVKIDDPMTLLATELNKGIENFSVREVERLLSRIYQLQAEVKDPSTENLYILWREFKQDHLEIFAQALAMIVRKKIDEAGLNVEVIIGMPNSATWMTEIFVKYFPKAQTPVCTKDQSESDQNFLKVPSLTYTDRDDEGKRKQVNIYLEKFYLSNGNGIVLLIEDVLATGGTGWLFLESLKEELGVGAGKVFFVASVSMNIQGGLVIFNKEELIKEAYAPIQVISIGDNNQINTHV